MRAPHPERVIAPGRCLVCGETGVEGLCPECKGKMDALFDPRAFRCFDGNGYADGMFALFHYDTALPRFLILDLKRFGYRDCVSLFGTYLERARDCADFPGSCELITYSPRSLPALGARGFDHAKYLAEEASRLTGIPAVRLLSRSGFVRSQHKLPAEKRWENVKGSFHGERKLCGENILLIDDVVTSGATANEAARTLKAMGAMHVFVLCLAH